MNHPGSDLRRATPAGPVFAFTFANSLGTGVVTTGIYFLTTHAYGFSRAENYLLGVAQGITYVVAAFLAGPLVRGIRRNLRISSRTLLIGLMLLMAALCALPIAGGLISGQGRGSAWSIWATVTLYSPLTGLLWPLVESYLSGGLRGEALRSRVGWWNVAWSSALVVAYLGVSPLAESSATIAILALGLIHLGSIALLVRFPVEPPAHLDETPHTIPASYPALLTTFRVLLPASYLLMAAMSPYLPKAMGVLGVAAWMQMGLSAAWLLPRTLTFALLQQWQGWHGRWWHAGGGAVLLLGGFGATVLSAATVGGRAGLILMIAGLACFGVGLAVTYCGAIYYALEVGQSEVDAGGTHEALIGAGYTAGPAIGLAAAIGVRQGFLGEEAFEGVILGVATSVAVGAVLVVVRHSLRGHGHHRQD
ncbi:MAG: hypothetical protein IPM33_00275 [Phycisphaerales bacterium]|nr:hypothetical protein [Phycisphaerales bacterium]